MGVGSINKKKSMRKLQIWGKYIDGPNDATIFFLGGFLFVLEKKLYRAFFFITFRVQNPVLLVKNIINFL